MTNISFNPGDAPMEGISPMSLYYTEFHPEERDGYVILDTDYDVRRAVTEYKERYGRTPRFLCFASSASKDSNSYLVRDYKEKVLNPGVYEPFYRVVFTGSSVSDVPVENVDSVLSAEDAAAVKERTEYLETLIHSLSL